MTDSTWNTWLVRDYCLKKRPKKMDPEMVKARNNECAKRYYRRRVQEIETRGDEMKEAFDQARITEAEYAKFLLGKSRAEFTKSREIEKRVEEWICELNREGSSRNGEAVELQTALTQLNQSRERSHYLMRQMMNVMGQILRL